MAMETIVSWAKRRGFVWTASELYGGIGSGYDYGPLGSQLKKNVTNAWWRDFVEHRGDCVSMESSLILNPKVWEASGHVSQFVDPLAECTKCKRRLRADKAVDAALAALPTPHPEWLAGGTKTLTSLEDLGRALEALGVTCPGCGSRALGQPRHFNLLFQTHVGPLGGDGTPAYLRPETAQGAYVHFLNLLNSTRRRLPFGVGQVGKSFRNEIATGNFLFRTREFDQAELQYFVPPQDSPGAYRKWVEFSEGWLQGVVGLRQGSVRRNEYAPGELAHYALATTDIMFKYPFGWEELMGIANRGDYDLKAHSAAAKLQLAYTSPDTPGEVRWGVRVYSRV
jgi:glycyl-tRNA synthetase